jgi:hypothetical protein
MDASKKGTDRKAQEAVKEEQERIKKAIEFIFHGSWPGENAILPPEICLRIINDFLYDFRDCFEGLGGFRPISSLINCEHRKWNHVTEPGILDLEEGVGLNIHCRRIYNFEVENAWTDLSNSSHKLKRDSLLFTRKQEWIRWRSESIWTKSKKEILGRVIYTVSEFKKVGDLLSFIDGSIARSILDNFYLIFQSDITEKKRKLAREEQASDTVQKFYNRLREVMQ